MRLRCKGSSTQMVSDDLTINLAALVVDRPVLSKFVVNLALQVNGRSLDTIYGLSNLASAAATNVTNDACHEIFSRRRCRSVLGSLY